MKSKQIHCKSIPYRSGFIEVWPNIHPGHVNLEIWNLHREHDLLATHIADERISDSDVQGNTEIELNIDQAKELIKQLSDAIAALERRDHAAIKVRQACEEDLDQLCEARNNRALFTRYLRECDSESAYFLVAELEQQIVGFGLIYLASTKAGSQKSHLPKMSDIYVVDHHRREGVATTLVAALEALAAQYGHSEIFLSIDPAESVAMTMVARKLAYEPAQEIPYAVSATFYDETGAAYQKRYTRQDYSKKLP